MYFDSHAHLQFNAFRSDYKEAIQRALDAGIWLVNVGTQQSTSRRAVEAAHAYPEGVFAAVGLHPIHTEASHHDADELGGGEAAKAFTTHGEQFDYDFYKKLALDPKTVAIGECGLDYAAFLRKSRERLEKRASAEALREGGLSYNEVEESKKKQEAAFLAQIELAYEVKKPLMIHCRDAYPDLIHTLNAKRSTLNPIPGIAHFFSGTVHDAKDLLEMGFYFTFGGTITFPPRKGKTEGEYDALVRYIPTDRILSETDAPYVAPQKYRGKRNESLYVVEVVKRLAELKQVSFEEMRDAVSRNAKAVFGLS